jgi:hypothetical protein
LVGVHSGPLESDNLIFDNLTVSGYTTGINLPRRGYAAVIGGTFTNNYYDLVLRTAGLYDRNILITGQSAGLKIKTEFDTTPIPGYSATSFFVKDVVTLNFGQFVNQRLYGVMQMASMVPFPIPRVDIPAQYVGLTNQQLMNNFGFALGGSIAPSNFLTIPSIVGLIAPNV